MPLRICLYEDDSFDRFFPLTLLRPVYMLRAGVMPLYKRLGMQFPDASVSLVAREQTSTITSELAPDYPVNIIKRENGGDVLFLNGRMRSFGDLAKLVKESRLSTIFTNNGEVVGVLFKIETLGSVPSLATHVEYQQAFSADKDISEFSTTATLYRGWWEMIADIDSAIAQDCAYLKTVIPAAENLKIHEGAYLVNKSQILFGNNVEVLTGAVIDASKGPVYIGENVRIESHAAIIGPSYIGADSIVVAGKIVASSVGQVCRVGGEVEESVFQSHINKFHAGFIGHSYVGSWVNFGAMTTNSDLKNNYSSIRVAQNGEMVDSEQIKVGSCIGDHTKFGIGTLLNTGITIGVCCNIFGGGLTSDKEIPSFSWGNTAKWESHQFDKALETASRSAGRRNVTLSEREIELLKAAFEKKIDRTGTISFA